MTWFHLQRIYIYNTYRYMNVFLYISDTQYAVLGLESNKLFWMSWNVARHWKWASSLQYWQHRKGKQLNCFMCKQHQQDRKRQAGQTHLPTGQINFIPRPKLNWHVGQKTTFLLKSRIKQKCQAKPCGVWQRRGGTGVKLTTTSSK